jgi:hypothetical protein
LDVLADGDEAAKLGLFRLYVADQLGLVGAWLRL